jgi:hypothetical protein
MSEIELYDQLKNYVDNEVVPFPDAVLIRFKDGGGSQLDAYKVCEQIRQLYSENETLEDRIMDVMDIVSGWCMPHKWIWDKSLSG